MESGYIYILTNPSFPDYVKIGYADDIEKRLANLNRSECTPFAFRVYAYYKVNHRLTDLKIHNIIDKLNPNLRSIDNVNGKQRVREFYAMSKEDAYELLEAIAEINGMLENLVKVEPTEKEQKEEEEAKTYRSPTNFYDIGLKNGDELVFVKDPNVKCVIVSAHKVLYKDEEWSLSALANEFIHKEKGCRLNGFMYFTYKGERLWDRRLRLEENH